MRAAPLAHTAPCVGFVVEEAGKPGRLRPDAALPALERNREAIREEWGVRGAPARRLRTEDKPPARLLAVSAASHASAAWPVLFSTDPRTLLKKLAALAPGETFALPDGAALAAEDVQSAPRRGRKVVVLGDCSDCSQIVPLGRGCGPLASAPQLP